MGCLGNCGECAELATCGGSCLSDGELDILQEAARLSRLLILDMVESAGSGHLGMALGCAEIGAALFGKFLRYDSSEPNWLDRDRFVLSAGHGSAFLYAWLRIANFHFTSRDLKNYRQSKATSGHPCFNPSRGVEITAGPLGQGVANAVGMAVAQKELAARLGEDSSLFQGRIICLAGDGCLQEGVALEALTLAGLWHLDNLILIYDCNGITSDGPSTQSNAVDGAALLDSLGWRVQVVDGHDLESLCGALIRARALPMGLPQAIIARTVAGKGVPALEGSPKAHGCSLVGEDWGKARQALGVKRRKFFISIDVQNYFFLLNQWRGNGQSIWQDLFQEVLDRRPDLGLLLGKEKPLGQWLCTSFPSTPDTSADLHHVGGEILRAAAKKSPRLLSLSADLFQSTKTLLDDGKLFAIDGWGARNVQCGVREHAMGALANGIAYGGIFRPVISTFLVFSDYLRPALRLVALEGLPLICIFTHDSIAVGADGATHQPVEMLPSLRAIPGLDVVRPADSEEVVGAYALALDNISRPTAIILPRQKLPSCSIAPGSVRRKSVALGAYVLRQESEPLSSILLATGSEVQLALAVARFYPSCRVVSCPCLEAFERQKIGYKKSVLPPSCTKRLSIEAAGPMPWFRYVAAENAVAVTKFGECCEGKELLARRGFTVDAIRSRLEALLGE